MKVFPVFPPQHVVFFIGGMIDMMVPDIPEEVEMKIKREHYMAKEALAENQVQQSKSKSSALLHHFLSVLPFRTVTAGHCVF